MDRKTSAQFGELIRFFESAGFFCETRPQLDFLELVYRIAVYRHDNPAAKYGGGQCLAAMAAERGRYYLALDQQMKHAARRVIYAPMDLFKAYGICPIKRTTCSVAWSLSELVNFEQLTV